MDYSRIYNQLIERGQLRQQGKLKKDLVVEIGYVEQHHIIPRTLGGTNDSDNLVYLTPEEHYLAHGLLCKIHPKNILLFCAIMYLSGKGKNRNNKLYGWARRRYSDLRSSLPSPLKGTKRSMPAWNKGIASTDETCAKQSALKKKRVSIDNIIYESLKDAAKAVGFDNYNRVTTRCNSKLYPTWFFIDITNKRKKVIRKKKGKMSKEIKDKMRQSKAEIAITPWNKGVTYETKIVYRKEECPHCLKMIGINRIKDHINKIHLKS
jgi:signal recognition particle subunit SEC65